MDGSPSLLTSWLRAAQSWSNWKVSREDHRPQALCGLQDSTRSITVKGPAVEIVKLPWFDILSNFCFYRCGCVGGGDGEEIKALLLSMRLKVSYKIKYDVK